MSGQIPQLVTGTGLRLDVMTVREEPQKDTQPQPEQEPTKISLLINSIYYFLDSVFIMKDPEDDFYKLVVIHDDQMLTFEDYKTAKGARIGFVRLHGRKACKADVRAQWSVFYPPETPWLRDKLNVVIAATETEKDR